MTAGVNSDKVAFDVMKSRLVDGIKKFNSAPFTIQRLCELLIKPTKHYKSTEKFMRGIEKNLLVVSTVDPEGNKITKESPRSSPGALWATPYPISQQTHNLNASPSPECGTPPESTNRSGRFSAPWPSGKPPNPFDSPSVRGLGTLAGSGSRRRASPYPSHLHEPRKRLRIETGTSTDSNGSGGGIWNVPFYGCDEANPPPAVHSPILGHLLSDKDDDDDPESTANDGAVEAAVGGDKAPEVVESSSSDSALEVMDASPVDVKTDGETSRDNPSGTEPPSTQAMEESAVVAEVKTQPDNEDLAENSAMDSTSCHADAQNDGCSPMEVAESAPVGTENEDSSEDTKTEEKADPKVAETEEMIEGSTSSLPGESTSDDCIRDSTSGGYQIPAASDQALSGGNLTVPEDSELRCGEGSVEKMLPDEYSIKAPPHSETDFISTTESNPAIVEMSDTSKCDDTSAPVIK